MTLIVAEMVKAKTREQCPNCSPSSQKAGRELWYVIVGGRIVRWVCINCGWDYEATRPVPATQNYYQPDHYRAEQNLKCRLKRANKNPEP